MSGANYLVNDDVALEVLTFSDREVDLDIPALGAGDIKAAELLFANGAAVIARGVVVLMDERGGIVCREGSGNVAPTLVVVHAKGDNEVLVVAFEAEDTGSAASAHSEDLLIVGFCPSAAISIVPDRLFDDLEPGVGFGLVDAGGDGVRHGTSVGEVRIRGGEQLKACILGFECF